MTLGTRHSVYLRVVSAPIDRDDTVQFDRDEQIVKAVGRVSPDTGYDWEANERYHGWNYLRDRQDGEAIGKAILAVAKLPHVVRVEVL